MTSENVKNPLFHQISSGCWVGYFQDFWNRGYYLENYLSGNFVIKDCNQAFVLLLRLLHIIPKNKHGPTINDKP